MEIQAYDEQMKNKAFVYGMELYLQKKDEFQKLYQNYSFDREKAVMLELYNLLYYFEERDEAKLKQELKLCENILTSDICIRNTKIREEITIEVKRLRLAVETDIVKYTFCSLLKLYKEEYPDISKTERIVRTSTIMNYLGLYKEEPFMTESMAKDHLKKEDINAANARKHIVNITKYYWKNCI
ncbi:MAG: hypothetical protein JXR54_04090 [Tannerellaceae bacterium]|nr:hypothetical protein [Tannerellaceae bacterium]